MASIYYEKQMKSYLDDMKKLEVKILENLNLQKDKNKKSQDIDKNMLIKLLKILRSYNEPIIFFGETNE